MSVSTDDPTEKASVPPDAPGVGNGDAPAPSEVAEAGGAEDASAAAPAVADEVPPFGGNQDDGEEEELVATDQDAARDDGAPVDEGAVEEEAVAEEAAAEEAVAEEAVAEETVAEETVAEETVAEETVAEETVAEEAVAEEAVAEEAVAEEAVAEEAVAEEAVAEEAVAGEAVAEETVAVDEEAVDEEAADEAVIAEIAEEEVAEEETEIPAPGPEPHDLPATPIIDGRGQTTADQPAVSEDLKKILDALQESLVNSNQQLSAKLDAVSDDTAALMKRVDSISAMYEQLTADLEYSSSAAKAKSFLSKTFMAVSSIAIALLAIFQVYMYPSFMKNQHNQNTAVSSVLQNMSSLDKKMAGYDKNLTKALEKPVQQAPAAPPAEKAVPEAKVNTGATPVNVTSLPEKLNKCRNGLSVQKLIRNEKGDWFVANKKGDGYITDVEVIEALDRAYKRYYGAQWPNIPLEVSKRPCFLVPDGRGGTEIAMDVNEGSISPRSDKQRKGAHKERPKAPTSSDKR